MPLRKQKKRTQRGAEYLQTKADEVLEIKSSQECKAKARARYLGNPVKKKAPCSRQLQCLKMKALFATGTRLIRKKVRDSYNAG